MRGASEVFAEFGYDRASMDALAEAAGVTKATVYAHFSSKAGLFEAVIRHWLVELPAPSLPNPAGGALRAQLNAVARELLRQAAHPAALAITRMLSRSTQVPAAYLEQWYRRHAPHRQHLEKILSHCSRCGSPSLAASQFLLLVTGSPDPDVPVPADDLRVAAAVDLFVRAYADPDLAGHAQPSQGVSDV